MDSNDGQRLIKLEEKLSYLERTLQSLDQTAQEQGLRMERLEHLLNAHLKSLTAKEQEDS